MTPSSCRPAPDPNEAGVCLDLIRTLGATTPLFGVCLGMQAMGQAYGGEVVRAPAPMHGKISQISHAAAGCSRASWHHCGDALSLADRAAETCPAVLAPAAETDDG